MTQRVCCCGKCFFGASSLDPEATACAHNQTEVLKLRIPRPAYAHQRTLKSVSGCDCDGSYISSTTCPTSPTIEVGYDHFHPTTRTYTWFYEPSHEVWPPCSGAPCCGYENSTYSDTECCGDGNKCYLSYRTHEGLPCSRYQGAAINPGDPIPHLGSNADAEDCSVGDQYWFLRDVANHPTTAQFHHWAVVGGVVTQMADTTLERTMLCVVHKEKWWDRVSNSLTLPIKDGGTQADITASNCRTPKYWIFACSGIPLYTWEIRELSSLTTAEQDDLIIKVTNGDAIPEAYCDTLEADGILFAKDYGRADGKVIKKTLKFKIGHVSYTSISYFFARPGGWTYVCQDWTSVDPGGLANFPQITRRYSVSCLFGGDNNCWTASPLPGNDCVCGYTGDALPGGCVGDPCTGFPNCDPPVVSTCGADGCARDTIIGNCKGCWVQFSQYFISIPGSSTDYKCNIHNNGYICRIDPAGTCDFGQLPTEMSHWIPSVVSASYRGGNSALSDMCCDGDGTYNVGGTDCPALTPNAAACDEPPIWGPGT